MNLRMSIHHIVALSLLAVLTLSTVSAQDLADSVYDFTLDNGLRVIMVDQEFAPTISFNLMFDVGGVDEPPGLGGIAHMVEHMAFKGTRSIGSKDPVRELELLAEVELNVNTLAEARENGASEEELAELEQALNEAQERALELQDVNYLERLMDQNGAVGLNASTGYDRTSYVVSLPNNRLELYARIYADILLDPVFRSFYEEADVVREERRQRSEDDPRGALFEVFLREAFKVHPYGRPLIGDPEEIAAYRTEIALDFFDTFYQPNRAVLVLAGDVEPERDLAIIENFFGALPEGSETHIDIPSEPLQSSERRVEFSFDAEPQVIAGYHKPTYPDRSAYVLDVASAILSSGRTSRIYKRMVVEERTALSAFTGSSFPGTRYPNLFIFYALPRSPHTTTELEEAFYQEVERLQTDLVDERELEKVKNQVRAGFIRSLASSSGLASQIAFYELFLGGWENLVSYESIIETVTAEEVREAARRYLVPENRTVATLISEGSEDQ
ncbi:MAG: insulinase family protein [Trueperaceae bacterium]|nr:MAG: insulinase family protein [Trueperaceae bacterium]